ncbi:hypothetical protein [Paenibacillus rigui]|uniref:Uncharacterized protein n=1 Tax=Paenibacillus rigui TaxID=554312 RepID=A0A229UH93_9BACL|nr:hypothetical protein [Paenibacillus rigui]OXM82731.1 hypothetical protein CF651_29100 [Paenibacillus rigui]
MDTVHYHDFIDDLISRNKEIFSEEDFTECRKAVTELTEIVHNLEETQTKFRRKLSEAAANEHDNKEKIIYLQGLVDGMNLVVRPLKSHVQTKPVH